MLSDYTYRNLFLHVYHLRNSNKCLDISNIGSCFIKLSLLVKDDVFYGWLQHWILLNLLENVNVEPNLLKCIVVVVNKPNLLLVVVDVIIFVCRMLCIVKYVRM